jgi:hypothetical protein
MDAATDQVVAQPSVHPTGGQPYRVEQSLDILRLPNLNDFMQVGRSLQAPAGGTNLATAEDDHADRRGTAQSPRH